MSNKMKIENEEQLVAFLKDALEAVKTHENPEELNSYRSIFKKTVPITMRSYVAAYLIKQSGFCNNENRTSKKNARNVIVTEKTVIKQNATRHTRPKVILSEEDSTSLFIGIGRKRGIFPKDIITLLIQGAGISREHIGDIRILDNYCFVQVMQDEAEIIIDKLNNSYYRGKTLTVSPSRKPVDDEVNEEIDVEEEAHVAVNAESGAVQKESC